MVRILFVCLGNICRSPIAQGIFEDLVRREGLEGEIHIDSATDGPLDRPRHGATLVRIRPDLHPYELPRG